jgi:hypothetical protein
MPAPLLERCALLLALVAPGAGGCEATDKTTAEDRKDSAAEDAGEAADAGDDQDGGTPDCFENPRTHEELINACTNAEKIEKQPTLPLLLRDGGLPPLP